MEGSSPLAFQRPLPVHTSSWGSFHNDARTYNTNLLVPFPQQNHNTFRNIPTRTRPSPSSDYFSCKTVSSPASGLAVDLAQNLHVDQRYVLEHKRTCLLYLLTRHSPQYPTPKRTLFTHGMLSGLRGRIDDWMLLNSQTDTDNSVRHHPTNHLLLTRAR